MATICATDLYKSLKESGPAVANASKHPVITNAEYATYITAHPGRVPDTIIQTIADVLPLTSLAFLPFKSTISRYIQGQIESMQPRQLSLNPLSGIQRKLTKLLVRNRILANFKSNPHVAFVPSKQEWGTQVVSFTVQTTTRDSQVPTITTRTFPVPVVPQIPRQALGILNLLVTGSDTYYNIYNSIARTPLIYDQGAHESCSANAVATAYAIIIPSYANSNCQCCNSYYTPAAFNPARRYLYWNAYAKHDSSDSAWPNEYTGSEGDGGSNPQDELDTLIKLGVPNESLCPYDNVGISWATTATGVVQDLSPYAFGKADAIDQDAALHKLNAANGYTGVHTQSVADIKLHLLANHPVVFCFAVMANGFDSVGSNGFMQLPSTAAATANDNGKLLCPAGNNVRGWHCVVAVGFQTFTSADDPSLNAASGKSYSPSNSYVIVQNSWGSGWGDAGFCYMPYEFFSPTTYWLGDYTTGVVFTGSDGTTQTPSGPISDSGYATVQVDFSHPVGQGPTSF